MPAESVPGCAAQRVAQGAWFRGAGLAKPGHYLDGAQYRPAHIHLKASAPGFRPLTTQLYFPEDAYNGIDPWFDAARLVSMESGSAARFDVVLAPV